MRASSLMAIAVAVLIATSLETGRAASVSVQLIFDEGGHISFTTTPSGGGPSSTLGVNPLNIVNNTNGNINVTTNASGFDTMGNTLVYTLPTGYGFTADGGRSAWILYEPTNSSLVSDLVMFIGAKLVVYDQAADPNPLELAKAYSIPLAFPSGAPTGSDPSTPGGLLQDLKDQNTGVPSDFDSSIIGAETVGGTNTYVASLTSTPGYVTHSGDTVMSTSITFVDAVPLPSAANAGIGLLGGLAGMSGLAALRRRRVAMGL